MPIHPNATRCSHIKVNGLQCGSPALLTEKFCFFHHRDQQRRYRLDNALAHKRSTLSRWAMPDGLCQSPAMAVPFDDHAAALLHALDLPLLEDAFSIQVALTNIMRALATQQIAPRYAGLLLYALQIASSNMKHLQINREEAAEMTDTAVGELPPSEFDPRVNIRAVNEEVVRPDALVPHVREAEGGANVGNGKTPTNVLLDNLVTLGNQLVRDHADFSAPHRRKRNHRPTSAELIFGKAATNGAAMRTLLERLEQAAAKQKKPVTTTSNSVGTQPPSDVRQSENATADPSLQPPQQARSPASLPGA